MNHLNVRVHNEKAFHANINGREMDYINPEAKALERQIAKQHAEQDRVEMEARMRRELEKNG